MCNHYPVRKPLGLVGVVFGDDPMTSGTLRRTTICAFRAVVDEPAVTKTSTFDYLHMQLALQLDSESNRS